jgi:hypothetical protein
MMAVFELKNRRSQPPEKNDVIVFFAKLLDYFARNPTLLYREVCPIFISSASFEVTGLAACLGLGIHPVAPGLRPLPVLVDAALRMAKELGSDLIVPRTVRDQFDDFCARVNGLGVALSSTWFSNRFGCQSETTIVVKAIVARESLSVCEEFRQVNGDCTELLREFKKAKGARR